MDYKRLQPETRSPYLAYRVYSGCRVCLETNAQLAMDNCNFVNKLKVNRRLKCRNLPLDQPAGLSVMSLINVIIYY